MATKTVNLDALIPRDDFVGDADAAGGSPRQTIGISDLDDKGFFQNSLRKPDFQRETTHWSPDKVVDLVRAFLDGDLIPAVILWERGEEVFVIDGAHRLSALIAWIRDDYGDGSASNASFGSGLTDEQQKIAERTRKKIKKEIGTYAEFRGLLGQNVADKQKARRLSAIGKRAVLIQWVTAASTEAAEASFFKINQAAQPIDPVERRILQSRNSPNAIASRCIVRGGKGHKYWSSFDDDTQKGIEVLGAEVHDILYKPPYKEPTTTPDQPVAGQGYNALPFVYNLVSLCNGIKIPTSLANKKLESPLPPDMDGSLTLEHLKKVRKRLGMVTTNDPGSFGFHPLIYYYANSGTFLANAFLASLEFSTKIDQTGKRDEFTQIRKRFEKYLFKNKVFVSLTISRLGSGSRSLQRIADLYWNILEGMVAGKSDNELFQSFIVQDEFVHLKQAEIPSPNFDAKPSQSGAKKQTKSAAFIKAVMENPTRCHICGAAVHSNSITFDHVVGKAAGGDNHSENLKPTHPYCNSGFKTAHPEWVAP